MFADASMSFADIQLRLDAHNTGCGGMPINGSLIYAAVMQPLQHSPPEIFLSPQKYSFHPRNILPAKNC